MYFTKFPTTFYSLDDRKSIQVITNIFLRIRFDELAKNNLSYYDFYDIKDSDTPEIIAYNFYGDPNLHWVILLMNEILDPRYDFPLDPPRLNEYVSSLYYNINATHHYEDSNNNTITGNVTLNSSADFSNFNVGDVVYNLSSNGKGYITSKLSSSSIIVSATEGGFVSSDIISTNKFGIEQANITSTSIITGIPITNFLYEDNLNEEKRRIKILKRSYVTNLTRELEKKLSE